MFRQIYSILRIAFIILQNVVFIPSYLFTTHVVLYPIYLCDSRTYWKIENHLYNFLLYVVSSWSWCAGIVGELENFKCELWLIAAIRVISNRIYLRCYH